MSRSISNPNPSGGNKTVYLKTQAYQWLPGDPKPRQVINEMLRVDQAGEYGATLIYRGQISWFKLGNKLKNELISLKKYKHTAPLAELKHMLEQEVVHLAYFTEKIAHHDIRPTVLQPLWHVGGLVMGFISAVLGKKAAMTCTVAVEEVIAKHYGEQLELLSRYISRFDDHNEHDDSNGNSSPKHHLLLQEFRLKENELREDELKELKEKITQFRSEELEHRDIGIEHDAGKMPFYLLTSLMIGLITKTAVEIAKKI